MTVGKRRDLEQLRLHDYTRTNAPGEAHTAVKKAFGAEVAGPTSTFKHQYRAIRDDLPAELMTDVMDERDWHREQPPEAAYTWVTKVVSMFAALFTHRAAIVMSKEAQAAIARAARWPADTTNKPHHAEDDLSREAPKVTPADVSCPSPIDPNTPRTALDPAPTPPARGVKLSAK
jgi:hypothetical protein